MWTRRSLLAALGAATLLRVGSAKATAPIELVNASYDPAHEVFMDIDDHFVRAYAAQAEGRIVVKQNEGGSANQAHAIVDGLLADIATLANASDISLIERAGLVAPGWRSKLPDNAAPYTSTVAFLVRRGNPKGLRTWQDLLRPGVVAVTANPKTSGGGRWTYLSLWAALAGAPTHDLGSAAGAAAAQAAAAAATAFPALTDAKVRAEVAEFYNRHVPDLKAGARAATHLFTQAGAGDVLLNWESELRLSLEGQGRQAFEIVYPPMSILGEPPVAVVDAVVDVKGTRAVAEAYVGFLYSDEAQEIFAQHYFRPRNPAILRRHGADLPPLQVFTVEETFGGWDRADATFFADGGLFDADFKGE